MQQQAVALGKDAGGVFAGGQGRRARTDTRSPIAPYCPALPCDADKPYKCDLCGKAFSNSSNRRKHEKTCQDRLETAIGGNLPTKSAHSPLGEHLPSGPFNPETESPMSLQASVQEGLDLSHLLAGAT